MKRKTIKNSREIKGVGLHSGAEVTLKLEAADGGYGIQFVRDDLGGTKIPADISIVSETNWSTSLKKGDAEVITVEHLMSAISVYGITDLAIHLDGPEVPILEGSARHFCDMIEQAGITELEYDCDKFIIGEVMHFVHAETGADYTVLPADEFQVTVMIDYPDSPIQSQYASIENVDEFPGEIASARTFVLARDLLKLADSNLIQGGSMGNALVIADRNYTQEEVDIIAKAIGKESAFITDSGVFNSDGMRYSNEPARHKILDLIGDISLIGIPVQGKIIANKPGHTSNIAFARFLKTRYLEYKKIKGIPHYNPNVEPVVGLEGIKSLLPHRYPFLLVDKIIELSDNLVVGIKNITFNEQFFQGHFPGNPVFPGVLQMEALAQTGGILALSSVDDPSEWDTYFLKMDKVKFKNKVVPGDTLILKMELISPIRRGLVHMQGTTYVGNKLVSEGELIAQIIKRS